MHSSGGRKKAGEGIEEGKEEGKREKNNGGAKQGYREEQKKKQVCRSCCQGRNEKRALLYGSGTEKYSARGDERIGHYHCMRKAEKHSDRYLPQ